MSTNIPPVWEMVKDAVFHLESPTSYVNITKFIHSKWGKGVNKKTITSQIIGLTVNHHSRIHYPQAQTLRLTSSNTDLDLLYSVGKGHVVKYDVNVHGIWEIFEKSPSVFGVRLYTENDSAFLFTWNPKKWNWNIEKATEELQDSGRYKTRWICSSHRSAKPGDRVFIILVGSKTNGIFGSGFIASVPEKSFTLENKEAYFVQIDFEILFNPLTTNALPTSLLENKFEEQLWSPQSSGISIKQKYINQLEQVWLEYLISHGNIFNPYYLPIDEDEIFREGSSLLVVSTRYERNRDARGRCIEFYGYSCAVCDLNFSDTYGEIGKDFIHVHHLTTLADNGGKSYNVNPINDLRPVCPNCHAMLHTSNPPLTIDVLKEILCQNKIN
ncbi:HNH endonuclease [Dyadobacter frigoris]|nr:HNH endonuclease [Dyadobacter frigoris]